MFTGIITDQGRVSVREDRGDTRFVIETRYQVEDIALGASIACSGCCLTVIETGRTPQGQGWFAVEASGETLGDELGGHFVLGHVDGVADIVDRQRDGDSWRFSFRPPANLMKYIAPKGSVVLDGVSLTINEVGEDSFGVNIIPHTFSETGFGRAKPGDRVNLEVDALARYVARLLGQEG